MPIEPCPLSRATLAGLSPRVLRPGYDVKTLSPGIVHLGLGGFHRAHMARYTHDLMQLQPDARRWGTVGVGMLASDRRMWEALKPQDFLYTLVERQDNQELVSVIGSLCEIIYAGESSANALDAIDNPAVRIVSLTVTENGYCLNPATKRLDSAHPSIVNDLSNEGTPQSAIGILVEAYRRRRAVGASAFTAMSCDNIQQNGLVLRDAVIAMATLRDPGLAEWIAANASFPNSMVDRITPVTSADNIADLAVRFAIADRWPVFSEMFRQWVIEDRFVQGRPEWEAVGVQFVADVAPYEYMKLRLLNTSHLAIAGLGQLAGYVYVDETMRDQSFRLYMRELMDRETGATLPHIFGVDLSLYKTRLIERFANPQIKDTLQRINTDAPLNLLLDPIRDRLRQPSKYELLALALAAWMRRMAGEDDEGRPLTIVHPQVDILRAKALEGRADPRPLLSVRSLFGDLVEHAEFVATLEGALRKLYDSGARATLAQVLSP